MNNKMTLVLLVAFGFNVSLMAMDKKNPSTEKKEESSSQTYVLYSTALLTGKDKLRFVYPVNYFPERKKIIKTMLSEGHHPDSIVDDVYKLTPVKEAVLHSDSEFGDFLINHGARVKLEGIKLEEYVWRSQGRDIVRKLDRNTTWDVYASNSFRSASDTPKIEPLWRSQDEGTKGNRVFEAWKSNIAMQHFLLALHSGDLMSDQGKLDNLWGDKFFPQLKEIIKKMISEGHHPDSIVYQVDKKTPLKEALHFKDIEFFTFLFGQGASLSIDRDWFMTESDYDRYQVSFKNLIEQQHTQKRKNINVVNGIELNLNDID